MRRLLLSALLTTALAAGRVAAQPGADFGMLAAPKAKPAGLPAGVEPVRPEANAPVVNPFPLTASAGPWLICAASYLGPEGGELARQVCVDLREKHRLSAFIFNRGEEERRQHDQEWEARQKANPGIPMRRTRVRIQDQYAVLVAGFKDFESASAYLPKVRALPLPALSLDGKKTPYEVMTYQDPEKKTQMRRAIVNPYQTAMVVRNPLVSGTAARPKWDPYWKSLNEDEEYSLLRNPKPWSLAVKEYMGARTLVDRSNKGGILNAMGLGGKNEGEALNAAAHQARELAKFLSDPRFGFKTWVLHTRYSSVVCVGGFTGPDDPALHRVRDQLTQLQFNARGGGDPIGLLPNPVPVEVPRY